MRIGLDLDGVIADFVRAVKERFGTPMTESVYHLSAWYPGSEKEIDKFVQDPRTYAYLSIVTGASMGLMHLKRVGHSLSIFTCRPIAAKEITEAWVKDLRIDFDGVYVLKDADEKVENCKLRRMDVLIDDGPAYIEKARDAGLTAITFDCSYNHQVPGRRMLGWTDIDLQLFSVDVTATPEQKGTHAGSLR